MSRTDEGQGGRCSMCNELLTEQEGITFPFCSIECHERSLDAARRLEAALNALSSASEAELTIAQEISTLVERSKVLIKQLRDLGHEWTGAVVSQNEPLRFALEIEEKRVAAKLRSISRKIHRLDLRAFLFAQEAKRAQDEARRLRELEG